MRDLCPVVFDEFPSECSASLHLVFHVEQTEPADKGRDGLRKREKKAYSKNICFKSWVLLATNSVEQKTPSTMP